MNWEESSVNTGLKRDILRAWFKHENRYFLTGGSALGLFYLHHRLSYDLDLFTSEEVSHREVQSLIYRVAQEIGASCSAIRTAPDFQRFKFVRGDEKEVVDVVTDRSPQLDSEKELIDGVRVDTLREILANKLTTLLSRTERKDLVDLYFLEKSGLDLIQAIADAKEKDSGWDPAIVAMLLDSIVLDDKTLLLSKELDFQELEKFQQRLRLAIAELSLPRSD